MGQYEILMVTSRKISHFDFIAITARACVILKCLGKKHPAPPIEPNLFYLGRAYRIFRTFTNPVT